MAVTEFSGTHIPELIDANNVPAVIAEIFDNIDPMFNLKADDEADRDARYVNAPPGTIVVCPAKNAIWMKLSAVGDASQWFEVAYDTGWITAGFNVASGWSFSGGILKIRRIGALCSLKFDGNRTGGTIQASNYNQANPGNIFDEQLLTIPAGFFPSDPGETGAFRTSFSGGTMGLNSNGVLYLVDMHTNSKIEQDYLIRGTLTYMLG